MKTCLDSINRQELPFLVVDLLGDDAFRDGGVYAHIHDHRVTLPTSKDNSQLESQLRSGSSGSHLFLRPDGRAIRSDLQHWRDTQADSGNPVSEEAGLELEAKMLPGLMSPLCLTPDTNVARTANVLVYNERKYLLQRKRPRDWAEQEEEAAKKRESNKLMLLMDERRNREFRPKFSKSLFIEDWQKKKARADEEPMLALGDKKIKPRRSSLPTPQINTNNKKILRTLRFEQHNKASDVVMYTIMNVYDLGKGECECILRWGSQDGTSLGKGALRGNTLRFPLGNYAAAKTYVNQFMAFYSLDHKLVSDNAAEEALPANGGKSGSEHGTPTPQPSIPPMPQTPHVQPKPAPNASGGSGRGTARGGGRGGARGGRGGKKAGRGRGAGAPAAGN
ncbi:hypothetical protein HK097_007519 [Rhizophlyctis rosea]|uniref:Spt20-like SEP domain-containing protein n=1 Tax=Rhizophlyctis rosea TaxID=64517 RepID=A0AAD5SCZ9_9FUNG|nr:hypothetical protein HK097_007519 [Rhizophlyctis rosea]